MIQTGTYKNRITCLQRAERRAGEKYVSNENDVNRRSYAIPDRSDIQRKVVVAVIMPTPATHQRTRRRPTLLLPKGFDSVRRENISVSHWRSTVLPLGTTVETANSRKVFHHVWDADDDDDDRSTVKKIHTYETRDCGDEAKMREV